MHLEDVGAPELENPPITEPFDRKLFESQTSNQRRQSVILFKSKLFKLGHPMCLFGKGAFFQPYIPLQQIDVLTSPGTKSFLVGTSNALFTKHKACAIDVIVHVTCITR
jgi:hypothetical protein